MQDNDVTLLNKSDDVIINHDDLICEENKYIIRSNHLEEFCKELAKDNKKSFDNILKKFIPIYEDYMEDKALSYFPITDFIYRKLNDEQSDRYINNLTLFYDYIINKDKFSNEYHYIVSKIYDHSQLAISQLILQKNIMNFQQSFIEQENNKLYKLEKIANNTEEQIKNIVSDFNKKNDKIISDHQKELENLQINNVTVLGIFATIVATFFGFASFSATIFSSISQTETIKLLLLVSSTFLCFSLFLRLLIYLLCRLRSKSFDFPYYIEMFFVVVFFFALICTISDYSLPIRDKVDNVNNQSTTTTVKISEPIKVNLLKE